MEKNILLVKAKGEISLTNLKVLLYQFLTLSVLYDLTPNHQSPLNQLNTDIMQLANVQYLKTRENRYFVYELLCTSHT